MEDFIFEIDSDKESKTYFCFDKENTRVHSYEGNCPKTWSEVYKSYYAWNIITKQFYDDDEPEEEILFDIGIDEASIIPELPDLIDKVIGGSINNITEIGCGQPTSEWTISLIDDFPKQKFLRFSVFENLFNRGYRFTLPLEKAKQFSMFIRKFNDYALEHSVGI